MRIVSLASLTTLLVLPPLCISADIPKTDFQQEPQLKMPHPPRNPLRFTRVMGDQKQSLEVRYLDDRTISFKLDKSGRCSGRVKGTAKLKQYWWLGFETDENEAGEAVAVQEYVYVRDGKCTIYVRIDEDHWEMATVKESPGCSKNCPASPEPMCRGGNQRVRGGGEKSEMSRRYK